MKTIYTKEHTLLVDETQIVSEKDNQNDNFIYDEENHHMIKIIASHPPLEGCYEFETLPPNKYTYPKNCCVTKEGKTLMNKGCMERNHCEQLNTEDDVEKLAKSASQYKENQYWFKEGYTQAKSEKMFSLEQLKQAIELARTPKKITFDGMETFIYH